MKVLYSWLREFIPLEEDPYQLAELLTLKSIEVESVEKVRVDFKGVIVGEILAIKPHPRAERLMICEVNTCQRTYEVICGAPNVKEGIKVAFALPGARLGSNEIKIKEIRGVRSEGMICSERELGLSDEASGILVLDEEAPLGMDLGDYLGLSREYVLDISPTPNRGDCLSILGLAREISAILGIPLKWPSVDLKEEGIAVEEFVKVDVKNPHHCPRYTARFLWDVEIKPSPLWMRLRLQLSGMRPINNVVDVTNYVMLELGQPLHAFDYDRLSEGTIIVRLAEKGETIVTLDDKERSLDEETLLICDAKGPVAIAGVIGGRDSEIREDTKRVLLESAFFSPASIRRTSRVLRLETEASYRFSRGVDPEGVVFASSRAAEMIQRLSGAKVAKGVLDVYPLRVLPKEVTFDLEWVKGFLGMEVGEDEALRFLERLNFRILSRKGKLWTVVPPSYRFDISREVDIAEEFGRLRGYDILPESLPRLKPIVKEPKKDLRKVLKEIMVGLGFQEVITYSFVSPRLLKVLGLRTEALKLLNPLSEEQSVMRTSLIPGLIETARTNYQRGNKDLKVFELRRVFLPSSDELPNEEERLAALATGEFWPSWWREKGKKADFFLIKGCIERIFEELGIENVQFLPQPVPPFHPVQSASIIIEGEEVGVLGKLDPRIAEGLELDEVFLFELRLAPLFSRTRIEKTFTPLPKFPGTYRDIALVLDQEVLFSSVLEEVGKLRMPYLERVEVIDCYSGPPIPEGKKNITIRLHLRADDHTLTDEEANEIRDEVAGHLVKQGYNLR